MSTNDRRCPLESAPPAPAAEREPLTDAQILSIYADERDQLVSISVARAIEKAHGITPKGST